MLSHIVDYGPKKIKNLDFPIIIHRTIQFKT